MSLSHNERMVIVKKTLLWSTAILGMLTLTGCGSSQSSSTNNNQEKTEQSGKDTAETNKLLDEAKSAIDNENFHVAKEKLEEIQKIDSNNTQVKAILNQIDNYQQAKDKLSNKKYKEATQFAKKVEDESNGSVQMQDYASNLTDEIKEKQEEKASKEKEAKKAKKEKKKNDKKATSSRSSKNGSAKNLSTQEKETINQKMVSWCKSQAGKGGMAISDGGFITPRGYNEDSAYAVQTVDGPANIDLGNKSAGHDLNVVGYTTFYTPGDAGTSNDRGIGDGVKPDTIVDRYIWCDNGKVYELKAKFDGEESDSVLQGWYALMQDDEALERDDNVTFQASEDKAAIAEYHRLLSEYGSSSSSTKKVTPVSHKSQTVSSDWNSSKDKELNNFMSEWANEMGQSYVPGEIDTHNNYVKMGFQTWCTEDDYQEACSLVVPQMNGSALDYTCGKKAKSGQYQVVACYGPNPETIADEDPDNRHYYVFAIKDGKPIVLNTDDSEEVKPTANQALQQGFEKIANS